MDQWLNSYDKFANKQKSQDMRNRLKSKDKMQHYSAFFELYIFILFHNLGFKVEIEPISQSNKKEIDFLITCSNTGKQLYIEALTVYEGQRYFSKTSDTANAINIIVDRINEKIKSDQYAIDLNYFDGVKEADIDKQVIQEIQKWINDTPLLKNYQKQFQTWKLDLQAYQVSKPFVRIIASNNCGGVHETTGLPDRIREKIKEKAKLYYLKNKDNYKKYRKEYHLKKFYNH
jgi:hypothetical protein